MAWLSENQIAVIESFISENDAIEMPDIDLEHVATICKEIQPNTYYLVEYDNNRRIMYHMYKSSKDDNVYIMATSMRTMFTSYLDPIIGHRRI